MTLFEQELKRQGMTVTELGKRTNIPRSYLYSLKDGYRKNPSWAHVSRICVVLKCAPHKIFPMRYGKR